jgi:hypothetical protein
MADDIERAHCVFTFISERPRFRQIAQKRIESSGGASEKRNCVLQVMSHRVPRFIDGDFPEISIVSLLPRTRQRLTLLATLQEHADLFRVTLFRNGQ